MNKHEKNEKFIPENLSHLPFPSLTVDIPTLTEYMVNLKGVIRF